MNTTKKIPMRKCVGCQEMKNKREMLRVLKTSDNEFVLDATGKKAGRGAYCCYQAECLGRALKQGQLSRQLEVQLTSEVEQSLRDTMQQLLSQEKGQ